MSITITRSARKRGRLAATVLAVVAAGSVALAPAASAAPGQTSSNGLNCVGLITCGPFAASAYPGGPASNSTASANVVGLVTTGVINTTAAAGGATASVANVSALLSGVSTVTASAVSSQCTVDPTSGAVSGSSSIVGGSVSVLVGSPVVLATAPAPNTTVTLVDPAVASVVLNRQTTAPDGTLTVDAIYVTLLSGQSLAIATSTCGPTLLPIPVVAPVVAVGGGLLALVAVPVLGALWYRRRPAAAVGARA